MTNTHQVDIATFSFDGVTLGDVDSGMLAQHEGVELEVTDKELESIVVTLEDFEGEFLKSGKEVSLTSSTTPAEIEELLGEPYWRDVDDDELILFYEYQSGGIEVQFEFPDSTALAYITIARNGVLSDPEQRSAYGVDKPWPPTSH